MTKGNLMAWTCPYCDWSTEGNQGVITQHLEGCENNPNSKNRECSFCSRRGFKTDGNLESHENHCPYNPDSNEWDKSQTKCDHCGEGLRAVQIKEGNSYCSMSCSNSAVPRRSKKNKYKSCLSCQNDFEPKRQKQKYCSVSCFHDHRMDKIDREIREGLRDSPTRRTLRRYLIRHRGRSCSICDRSYWNDEEIPIELDHIDGDHTNNELENLRLVCPNCHAQTDTYKGANFGNGRSYRKKYYN